MNTQDWSPLEWISGCHKQEYGMVEKGEGNQKLKKQVRKQNLVFKDQKKTHFRKHFKNYKVRKFCGNTWRSEGVCDEIKIPKMKSIY